MLPLVIIEPDLGATVFLAAGYVLAPYVGGLPFRYFAGAAALTAPRSRTCRPRMSVTVARMVAGASRS